MSRGYSVRKKEAPNSELLEICFLSFKANYTQRQSCELTLGQLKETPG